MADTCLATVGEVFSDGLSLIFDGQEEPSEKHYKCNTSVRFSPGDRVRILPVDGTYIVEYIVGSAFAAGPASSLRSGSYSVTLSSTTLTPSQSRQINIGTSSNGFENLYARGNVGLGSAYGSTLGFFGATPVAKQSLTTSSTLAQVITALKNYGLG